MLTAEHVRLRKKDGVYRLTKLKKRAVLDAAAEVHLAIARTSVGLSREDLMAQLAGAGDDLVARGFRKLVLDRCSFDDALGKNAVDYRARLFQHAAKNRQSFDRQKCLDVVAAELDIAPAHLERTLFLDRKRAQPLLGFDDTDVEGLIYLYQLGRPAAVLLRARRLVAKVETCPPNVWRSLFRTLSFHGLLFCAERTAQGFTLTIDGPFSLFRSVTKYGLKLALAFRALAALPSCTIEADIVWGTAKREARFFFDCATLEMRPTIEAVPLRPELERVVAAFADDKTYELALCDDFVDVDATVVAPDLLFTHRTSGAQVYLELLGYWSRDAVWRRIEWAQQGKLDVPMIFAYSERLRVAAEALDHEHACLLPFKGAISLTKLRAALDYATR